MERRAFLTALLTGAATSLAGCSSIPGSERTSPVESPSGTRSPPGWASALTSEDFAAFSVIDLESIPRTYSLVRTRYHTDTGAEVRLSFTQTATRDNPPRVAASFHNRNQHEQRFKLDWTPPFGRLVSSNPMDPVTGHGMADATYRDALAFVPTERHELGDEPAEVSLAGDGTWRHDGAPARGFPEQITLQPQETVYGEYFLAGDPDGAGSGRPTGEYRFSRGQDGYIQVTVWDSEHPGPDRTSQYQGTSVPSLEAGDSIAWFHDADSGARSYVLPSTERTELPAQIDFTFVNHSDKPTECGHWGFYKLYDGSWYHLGPYVHTSDCRVLLPGGTKTWTVHAFHSAGFASRDAEPFGNLGGGRYAAVAGYGHATRKSAALVEVVADPISITPFADISAEQSDGTVTVTSARWDDDQHPPSATLTVTRSESGGRILIPEQVMSTHEDIGHTRYQGLRNSIPFFEEGIDEVELRTDERVAEGVVGHDSDVQRFRIAPEEQSYRVEIERQSE